jgi:NAD(P)-dependent dehydrogenase (short-subunit alcohol dehydrogenase family)
VFFASMAPMIAGVDLDLDPDPDIAAVLDDPLAEGFLDQLRDTVGPDIENTGLAYTWAKHGVHRFARAEAVRLGPSGARACSISPGVIFTPQGKQEAADKASMQRLIDRTPLGRPGESDDVAAVAAFLVSDDARFLSGIDVLVDGGVVAALRS